MSIDESDAGRGGRARLRDTVSPKLAASLARTTGRSTSKGVARLRDVELNALALTFSKLLPSDAHVAVVGWADPNGDERVEKAVVDHDCVTICVVPGADRPARTAFEVRRGAAREAHRRFDALLP
jgi:hypothetical protein